ncbi:hypothetical protein [Bradyrhizobium sp. HKCCYLR1051]|uniref:hypothetical protein n=1 Tax=Bradyrhizobium sp. HKCCYLR1051 TaxID=3420738 RepID=UPI003EBEC36A
MALVLAVIVLVLTLLATAVTAFGNGMSAAGGNRVSPFPVLTGGCLIALVIALSHGLPW